MKISIPALTLALSLLAGCAASREIQVRNALTNAGLSRPMAECMAEPLARDLSASQLRALARVGKIAESEVRDLSQRQILDLFRRDLDPETVALVVRSGLGCMLRG